MFMKFKQSTKSWNSMKQISSFLKTFLYVYIYICVCVCIHISENATLGYQKLYFSNVRKYLMFYLAKMSKN